MWRESWQFLGNFVLVAPARPSLRGFWQISCTTSGSRRDRGHARNQPGTVQAKTSDANRPAHPVEPDVERVLVLDADPTVRDALCRFLETHGHPPAEAATVAEAEEVAAATQVGALVLELRLAERTTGLELLPDLRQRAAFSTIPLIVVSGTFLTPDQRDQMEANRAFLFHKPDGLTALIGFLRRLRGRA